MITFVTAPYRYAQVGCSGSIISLTDLKAYYKLEDTSDSSGNAKTLTNTGTVTFASPGKFSNSACFITGSTNPTSATKRLDIAEALVGTSNSSNTSGFTFSGWFKFDNLLTTSEQFLFAYSSSGQRLISIVYEYNSGTRRLNTRFYNGSIDKSSGTYNINFTTGSNYHIAFVMQPSTGAHKLWLNGSAVISATNTTNGDGIIGNKTVIGNHPSAPRTHLGYIDDVAFFNRALSDSEISTIYNSSCPLNT